MKPLLARPLTRNERDEKRGVGDYIRSESTNLAATFARIRAERKPTENKVRMLKERK
jgi:hypothetical protein